MRVEWKRQANGFRWLSPDTVLLMLELLVLTLLAFQIARLGWTIVTPVTPFGDWRPADNRGQTPIDPAMLGSYDPFFRQAETGATAVSALSLTLLGTRVDTVSGRGSAIIATPDGKQASYLVGEEIVPGVRLKSVQFDDVTLDRAGAAESLFLDQSSGAAPVTPETAGIAEAPAAAAPAATPRLAADIQVTPRMNGTTISGYVLAPKGSGAAFAAAGLMPGDVLVTVDGAPVAAAGDPAALARRLDAGGVTVGVERGGRKVELRIGGGR